MLSEAKHTISDQQCSLKCETIELLKCFKSRFRLDIFTTEDLHTIAPDFGDDEGITGTD